MNSMWAREKIATSTQAITKPTRKQKKRSKNNSNTSPEVYTEKSLQD
jgi:hypothetical protein